MEAMVQGMKENESQDYGSEYQTRLDVKVVKKDGTRESFNVQKVVNAVGKSAYRALTKLIPLITFSLHFPFSSVNISI